MPCLPGYSAVTGYVYEHEIDRKRAYLEEGLLSRTNHKNEFRRALRYWSDMTYQYADDVTDSARIKAFTDAGVEQVQWHTAGDEKVCQVCRERNGEIYPIDNIPDKTPQKMQVLADTCLIVREDAKTQRSEKTLKRTNTGERTPTK